MEIVEEESYRHRSPLPNVQQWDLDKPVAAKFPPSTFPLSGPSHFQFGLLRMVLTLLILFWKNFSRVQLNKREQGYSRQSVVIAIGDIYDNKS